MLTRSATGTTTGSLPVAELLLGFAVWTLGLLFTEPLDTALETSALIIVVVYPTVTQLPLAAYVTRTRLARPLLVNGLFAILFASSALSVSLSNAAGTEPLPVWVLPFVLLVAVLLFVYYPLVVVLALAWRSLRWLFSLLLGFRASDGPVDSPAPADSGDPDAGPSVETPVAVDDDGDEFVGPGSSGITTTEPATGPRHAPLEDTTPDPSDEPPTEARTDPTTDPHVSRRRLELVALLGLILVPLGLGLQSSDALAGISISSFLLTTYEILGDRIRPA